MAELYEILVPASGRNGRFSYEHHKEWDEYVKNISGGLTILKTGKGQWIAPNGDLYIDRVIPVRIACSRLELLLILKFTKTHYNQLAIMAYKISDDVIIFN